jgi:hypothetical protein
MALKNFRNGVITFRDAGIQELEFTFDGLFTLEIPGVPIDFALDRGALPDVPEPLRQNEEPMSGSFDAIIDDLTDDAAFVPGDFVFGETGTGFVGSNWVSTVAGTSPDVLLVDIEFTDGETTFTLPDCMVRGNFAEAEDGDKLTFNYVCPHAYPTLS